ncbi:hypothetical protein OH768_25000 [Streptomyces sp. NBC_01622]|uniref:hypothetical protein n=1 Tax=Streptomyces sp. NBC_01622 TaxID=2975903 RepID=UPI00386E2AD5|nr:hypothetical protein OH768_25000 [Streptomyces sp. NBC_01622]
MDGALVTAAGVIGSAVVAGAAAMYGSKVAGRAQQEGTALTGYDNLTARLVAERDKAEKDQERAEQRVDVLELEVARLRLLVTQLGGTP